MQFPPTHRAGIGFAFSRPKPKPRVIYSLPNAYWQTRSPAASEAPGRISLTPRVGSTLGIFADQFDQFEEIPWILSKIYLTVSKSIQRSVTAI